MYSTATLIGVYKKLKANYLLWPLMDFNGLDLPDRNRTSLIFHDPKLDWQIRLSRHEIFAGPISLVCFSVRFTLTSRFAVQIRNRTQFISDPLKLSLPRPISRPVRRPSRAKWIELIRLRAQLDRTGLVGRYEQASWIGSGPCTRPGWT